MGVWIETDRGGNAYHIREVTPCVGVWIETISSRAFEIAWPSHPAWVCGLKLEFGKGKEQVEVVTPCVGVWIETRYAIICKQCIIVTPCVGVWIETR